MGWTPVHGIRNTFVKLFAGAVSPTEIPAQSVLEQEFSPRAFALLRPGDAVVLSAPGADPMGLVRTNVRVLRPGVVGVTWLNLRPVPLTPVAGDYVLLIIAVRRENEAP